MTITDITIVTMVDKADVVRERVKLSFNASFVVLISVESFVVDGNGDKDKDEFGDMVSNEDVNRVDNEDRNEVEDRVVEEFDEEASDEIGDGVVDGFDEIATEEVVNEVIGRFDAKASNENDEEVVERFDKGGDGVDDIFDEEVCDWVDDESDFSINEGSDESVYDESGILKNLNDWVETMVILKFPLYFTSMGSSMILGLAPLKSWFGGPDRVHLNTSFLDGVILLQLRPPTVTTKVLG